MWEAWFEYPGKGLDRKSKSYRIIAETFYMVKTLEIGLREDLGLQEIGGSKEAQEGGGEDSFCRGMAKKQRRVLLGYHEKEKGLSHLA
jgi:hypothetical protein